MSQNVAALLRHVQWRQFVTAAGFSELEHYYRPPGRPRHQQPWLVSVWRKVAAAA